MLRSIPAGAGVGWPSRVLEQLGALHLLIQAHRRLDELPADLAATVRSRIGYPIASPRSSPCPALSTTGLQLAWSTRPSTGSTLGGSGSTALPRVAGR